MQRSLWRSFRKTLALKNLDKALQQCDATRGPVAAICKEGVMRIDQPIEEIERSIVSYGSVQTAYFERGCSLDSLVYCHGPSLGFLGTVIGMVLAFDQIQTAGDISPTMLHLE